MKTKTKPARTAREHAMAAAKWIGNGAYAIAVTGTVASYGTQVSLLLAHGVGGFAYAIPATVDVLAICSAMALQLPGLDKVSRRIAAAILLTAVAVSVTANLAGGHNGVAQAAHAWPVIAYLLGELLANRVRAYAAKLADATNAVVMVAKTEADAQLATAMATAANEMATAVADAMATTEARVRAEMAAEAAELVAEAERATREAADAATAARIEADRRERERVTAQRLAAAEAERVRLADELAKAAAAAATKAPAKPANSDELATARVANGAASAMAMAILATDPAMATDEVIRVATAQGGVVPSGRTIRRAREQMLASVAA